MMLREDLKHSLDVLLACSQFKDYCPNGLQVEGKKKIGLILSGVTASLALIEQAIEQKADALLVHHGLFWKNQSGVVTGWMKMRLSQLLAHDINLFAYHLPLDAHPTLGNNAQLAAALEFERKGHFGEQNLGMIGTSATPLKSLDELVMRVGLALNKAPLVVMPPQFDPKADFKTPLGQAPVIAWCTGGAQGYFESAIQAGAQVFITGEISEPQAHLAKECGVVYMACGHHATERGGVRALGEHLAQTHGLEHRFLDLDNPA
jgi:dinuclear metal center YbgI/SA1388 family protein